MRLGGMAMSNGGSTPEQYALPEWATELQDLIEHRNMNFAVGNIFKACYRMGLKNDDLYEINKIIWFAERERDRIQGRQPEPEVKRTFSATASGDCEVVDKLMDMFGMKS
jgi:hypothetical protein